MNMFSRRMSWVALVAVGVFASGASDLLAQGPPAPRAKTEFSIRRIDVRFENTPSSGGSSGRGSREAGQIPWAKLECEFDSTHDWADDVVVKWYVLLAGRSKVIATGDDTYIYVKKGRRHVAGMFIHPFVLEKWTGGATQTSIEEVGVEIWYQDRPITFNSWRQAKTQWWNQNFPRQAGLLMRVSESPWFTFAFTDYEWSKHTTSKQQ